MAGVIKKDDLLVVNRNGVDHSVKWELVHPPIHLHEELPAWGMPWEEDDVVSWHIKNLAKVSSPEYDDLDALYVALAYPIEMQVYKTTDPSKNLADYNNIDDPDSLIFKADGTSAGIESEIQELIAEIQNIAPDYPDFVPLIRIPPDGNEYVIVHAAQELTVDGVDVSAHPLFLSDNMSWDFGELTKTTLVTTMQFMAIGAWEFTGDVGHLDMSNATDINNMTPWKFNHPSIGTWDTGKVSIFGNLFEGNRIFNQDISGWDMRSAADVHGLFHGAYSFNQDIGRWEFTSALQQSAPNGEGSMSFMFYNASSFNQDLSGWCVTNIVGTPMMIKYFDDGATSWTLDRPCWGHCPRGEDGNGENPCPGLSTIWHLQNLHNQDFDFKNNDGWPRLVTDIDGSNPRSISILPAQTEVLVDSGPDASGMLGQFGYNHGGEVRQVGPLSDTRGVTNMSRLYTTAFYVDGTYIDTRSCTNMSRMITDYSGDIVNIGHWDTSKVKDMSSMFRASEHSAGRTWLKDNLSKWDTSNVTDMEYMFNDSQINDASTSIGIENWDVSNVTNMQFMFNNCIVPNSLDISGWCVSQFTRAPTRFSSQTLGWTADKQPQWGTCPKREDQ